MPPVQKKELVSDAKRTTEKIAQVSKTASGSTEHAVKAGDTLSHLALQYYGHARKWQQIYEANKETDEKSKLPIHWTEGSCPRRYPGAQPKDQLLLRLVLNTVLKWLKSPKVLV